MPLILSLGSGKQDIVSDQFVCVKYGRFLPSIFFFFKINVVQAIARRL